MLKNLKLTAKNSIIYGLGNITTRIVGFLLLPLYTSQLSVSDYGVLGLIEISTRMLIAIFGVKLYTAFNRFYFDTEYKTRRESLFFTCLSFLFGVVILLLLNGFLWRRFLAVLLLESSSYTNLITMMFFDAGLQLFIQMPDTLLKIQKKALVFTITNIIKLIITLLLTIFFIVRLDMKVEGIYLAQIVGFIVKLLILAPYIIRNSQFSFHYTGLKELLHFSFPLAIASLAGVLLTIADRYCLRFLGHLADVGIYSLGYKMANTIKVFFIKSVQLAISPIMLQMMNKPGNRRFYSKIMTYFILLTMFFVLGISFFGREVIKFLAQDKKYWDAYKIIPVISFALLFEMMRQTANIGLMIQKKTKIISTIMIGISIINIGLNFVLIYFWQALGAAIATLIAQICFFLLIYHFAQKYYRIPYEVYKIVLMIIVGVILIALALSVGKMHLAVRIIVKFILLMIFPIILYFFKFYESIEVLRIKQSWQKWRNPKKWKKNISDIKFK